MRRWDLIVGASGVLAAMAFAFLIAVMVNPLIDDLSPPAYVALAAGVLGIVIGMIGMARETGSGAAPADDDSGPFTMNGRLDVYRQLQRVRSRNADQ